MTYIPTTYDEIARTFDRSSERGAPEWRTFGAVRSDHVEMYGSASQGARTTDDASHEMLDELLEDAYL